MEWYLFWRICGVGHFLLKRVPSLCGFWDLKKTTLCKIRVSEIYEQNSMFWFVLHESACCCARQWPMHHIYGGCCWHVLLQYWRAKFPRGLPGLTSLARQGVGRPGRGRQAGTASADLGQDKIFLIKSYDGPFLWNGIWYFGNYSLTEIILLILTSS